MFSALLLYATLAQSNSAQSALRPKAPKRSAPLPVYPFKGMVCNLLFFVCGLDFCPLSLFPPLHILFFAAGVKSILTMFTATLCTINVQFSHLF